MITKVFFFGDSITEGQFVGAPFRWFDIVAATVNDHVQGQAVECFMGANSGDTTHQGLARFAWQVQQVRPDILFIQFGLNDCNMWDSDEGLPRTSPRAFKANLAEMIERGRNFGARQVVLANNHATTKTNDWGVHGTFIERNAVYNEYIAEVAEEHSTHFIDIHAAFEESTTPLGDLLLSDNIHLNHAGHQLYAKQIMSELGRLLSEPKE